MKKTVVVILLCCLALSMFACAESKVPKNSDAPEKEEVPTPTKTKIDCFISEFRPYVVEPSDDLDAPNYLIVKTKAESDELYARGIQTLKNEYVSMVSDVSEEGQEQFFSMLLEVHETTVKTFANFDEPFFQEYTLIFVGLKRCGSLASSTAEVYIDHTKGTLHVDIVSKIGPVAGDHIYYTTAAVWIDKEIATQYAESIVIRNISE